MCAGRRAPAGAPRPQGGTGRWAETRIAPDGSVLTLTQFLRRYGRYNHWNRARRQRKAVMRLEPQAPPSGCCTPRGRTAGPEGGLHSPEAGGSAGGEHASPWMASALSQHSGPAAGCALDAVHLPPLRPAPLIRQEHAHSQAADALASLAAAEAALRREREAREESETTLKLQRTLARERLQQKDCAAALTAAEAALRSEQAARRELQEELSREKRLHQSATLVEKALLREIRRLRCEEEDARRELQAAAARADQLRQLLLAAEERAQAAQQRERDERSRASRLLFQAAQRAAERIERERASARGGDPAPDAVVGVGDRISLGGAGAHNSRDAEVRGPKNPDSGARDTGHVMTAQERAEIRRIEGRLVTSEIVVGSVAVYSPGRWLPVCRATARSVAPVLGCWGTGYQFGAYYVDSHFLNYGAAGSPYPGIINSCVSELSALELSMPVPVWGDRNSRVAVQFLEWRITNLTELYQSLATELREIQGIMVDHGRECDRAMEAISRVTEIEE